MTLTLEQLESIQADNLADDITIDFPRMSLWNEEQADEYFASGGQKDPDVQPPAPTAPLVPPPITPLGRKPRVAILHGTASNETITKMQLGKLLPKLRQVADVFIVEGPLTSREDNKQTIAMRQYFGDNHTLKEYALAYEDARDWRLYEDIDTAVARIEQAIASLPGGGGADVLMGFSQGANMTCILCARAERGMRGAKPAPYRAAVMLAPANPGWTTQTGEAFSQPLTTPAIIAYSDTDTQVCLPVDGDKGGCGPRNTAELFAPANRRVLHHAGPGHRPLPKDAAEAESVRDEILALVATNCPQDDVKDATTVGIQ